MWHPPDGAFHNGIIRHYVVNIVDVNTSESINITSTTSQPILNIGSLLLGREYACSVAAVTVSQGPFSEVIFFTTNNDGMILFCYTKCN